MNLNSGDLRSVIVNAFSHSIYPGDTRLLALDPDEDPDSREIYDLLRGKSWSILLDELDRLEGPELYWYSWIYSLLTPEAFYYYLPAFLVTASDPSRADTTGIYALYFLDPKSIMSGFIAEFSQKVVCMLTEEQREVVRELMSYLQDNYPECATNYDGVTRYWLGTDYNVA